MSRQLKITKLFAVLPLLLLLQSIVTLTNNTEKTLVLESLCACLKILFDFAVLQGQVLNLN